MGSLLKAMGRGSRWGAQDVLLSECLMVVCCNSASVLRLSIWLGASETAEIQVGEECLSWHLDSKPGMLQVLSLSQSMGQSLFGSPEGVCSAAELWEERCMEHLEMPVLHAERPMFVWQKLGLNLHAWASSLPLVFKGECPNLSIFSRHLPFLGISSFLLPQQSPALWSLWGKIVLNPSQVMGFQAQCL